MLHEALKHYLAAVEEAVLSCDGVYAERYIEEILTPERVNLRLRLRFDKGYLLEIHEAVIIDKQNLVHLDYRYHCQDEQNCLVFRYDCTPHFPDLASFPHHKHLPDCKRSVPLFGKEGLGEILLDKSPSIPLLQRGR